MRKTLLLFCFLAMTLIARAVDFEYDGVIYTILSEANKTVSTKAETRFFKPTGQLKLHDKVTYNGNTYTLTTIGDNSFFDYDGLTGSLTIPNSVTSIGKNAFYGCSGFTGSLIIPSSVTEIGSNAFSGCSGFTGSLTIPNSVTTIGSSTFSGCSGFTGSLTIPNTVTTIGNKAFYNCSGFTGSLTIPNSVTTIGSDAFNGCSGFTGSLTIPNTVTSIGQYAFSSCSGFTGSLTIPNSVTTIGQYTFSGCSGFTGLLTIPNTITTIGHYAFSGCSGFTGSLTIPSTVTSIGKYAFSGCSGFTGSLTIPSTVTSIEEYAFNGCSGFTGSLTIPSTITSIGKYAFSGCSGFTGSLTIPNTVTTIGQYAFSGCSGFTGSLTIPNTVTTIGQYTFSGCSGFTGSLTIPNTITTIGEYAFSGCSGFTGSLTIPNSVTSIGAYAFMSCTGFTGSLTIPDSVTSIGGYAFSGCSGFTGSLTISNKVTTINANTFRSCSGFTTLNIPESVNNIGSLVFDGCSGLNEIKVERQTPPTITANTFSDYSATLIVPSGSEVLYANAAYWKNFNKINANSTVVSGVNYDFNRGSAHVVGYTNDLPRYLEIPASITNQGQTYSVVSIENGAFANCTILEEVILPPTITSVSSTAFSGCNNLKKCAYPNSIDNPFKGLQQEYVRCNYPLNNFIIENKVIYNSSKTQLFYVSIGLSSVSIPNSVTSVNDFAFFKCSNFTSVSLPTELKIIGESAFEGCSNLKTITIPNSVTTIGKLAFYECPNLTSINIPSSVNTIGSYAFAGCNHLTKVEIEDIAKWMQITFADKFANPLCNGASLYLNGDKVAVLTIPETIKEVKDYAFYNCSGLTTLNIHPSVTKIGDYAFYMDTDLTTINSACATPPTIYSNTFSPFSNNYTTVLVSPESENLYRTAPYWENFRNIAISNRIYLGVLGFNANITEKPMAVLDLYSVDDYTDWVNDLTLDRNTLLYYTVDQAIDKMQKYNFGVKLANAVMITFTDGLDQGSLAYKPEKGTSLKYAEDLYDKIAAAKIQDIALKAYTIGVQGNDVRDDEMFMTNLNKLSSKPENVHHITNINQIDEKFDAIYRDLELQKNQLILTITVPMMENGVTYRFTLDGVSDAEVSKLYVEGVYNFASKRLERLQYVGFTSVSGTSVTAVQNGIDLMFTFEDCRDMNGDILTLANKNDIMEWYKTSNGRWQPNSEMSDTDIDLEKRNSTALMLLIDCSSSLGADDFSKLKFTANSFIERLIGHQGRYNGVEDIMVDDNDESEIDWTNAEYYNLQGARVMHPSTGVYIRRVGKHVQKVLLR